jgi:hypothetical protein
MPKSEMIDRQLLQGRSATDKLEILKDLQL